MGERNNADYQKYLKYKPEDSKFAGDKKYAWYNPDPKDRDTYASGEVVKEGKEEWVILTEEQKVI